MVFFYKISGLSVASEIAFAGLASLPAIDAPDVHIRRGAVPALLEGATYRGPNCEIADGRLILEIPGVVRMLLTEGREIVFENAKGMPEADAEIFLSGTAVGMLLHQRCRTALHASAVRVGDKAVLFCGPSGAGKSTIAAALGKRGYDLISDDLAAITARNGVAFVEPDGRGHKLWQQAIDGLELGGRKAGAVRAVLAKFHVTPSGVATNALPIGATYHLRDARPPHAPGIGCPNIIDAGLLVRRNVYRPAMVKRLGQHNIYFESAALLVGAGVFTLTHPRGFQHLATTMDWLEEHWAARGMARVE